MRHAKYPAPALPVTDWSLSEPSLKDVNTALAETLFAQANGYIGTRGTFEEGGAKVEGTYLNGVYVKEKIFYEENAYAFATHNDKMIQVPDGKSIRLFAGDEALEMKEDAVSSYRREIDFRTGLLTRTAQWKTKPGKTLKLEWRRLVSLSDAHLMAAECHITSVDYAGELTIESVLDAAYGAKTEKDEFDPRAGHLSIQNSLSKIDAGTDKQGAWMLHKTKGDLFIISSACTHGGEGWTVASPINEAHRSGQRFTAQIKAGQTLTFTKFISYHHSKPGDEKTVKAAAAKTLATASNEGFSYYAERQAETLQTFWRNVDVSIDGDDAMQQGMRFNLFHLFQSVGRNGACNIGAKGLTGPGYDGHYFWDTEIYMLPLFALSAPEIARALLEFRYGLLDASRNRARQMSHKTGALYAWRTISGDECSAYYPAGTAQYHINAAIAYAIKYYLEATGDWNFIWEMGAEMLLETARIWMGLGHFAARRGGAFSIHGVTGPDEYTAVVDNNFYTNAMARMHLRTAAMVAEKMSKEQSTQYKALAKKIGLSDDEIARWKQAAEKMLLPVDPELNINPQDDTFLNKPRWDFEGTPADKYPLLLHFHPLVIYRHQVLKQADVVLANVLLSHEFPDELKRRNLAFYEPLTTHDSTLSSCIYSIASSEAGKYEEAYRFFEDSARMDIDNNHNNTNYGIHTACMAGSWACVTRGFGGMRMTEEGLSFAPYLPANWRGYHFHTRYQNHLVSIAVTAQDATYTLLEGDNLEIRHDGKAITLQRNKPVTSALLARDKAA